MAELFSSCATEKREVSSANNLGLEERSSDISLIYTPRKTVDQEEMLQGHQQGKPLTS